MTMITATTTTTHDSEDWLNSRLNCPHLLQDSTLSLPLPLSLSLSLSLSLHTHRYKSPCSSVARTAMVGCGVWVMAGSMSGGQQSSNGLVPCRIGTPKKWHQQSAVCWDHSHCPVMAKKTCSGSLFLEYPVAGISMTKSSWALLEWVKILK